MKLQFDITGPGEPAAGIDSVTDTVIIEVEYGPGGEEGEFVEYMKSCLSDWYSVASNHVKSKIISNNKF